MTIYTPYKPYISIKRKIHLNEQLTCAANGCTKKRDRIANFCSKHFGAYSLYGHPHSKKLLRSKDYQREYDLTKEFIQTHIGHIGIGQALKFINVWLASDKTSTQANASTRDDIRRLNAHGVTALDILIESSAIWLLSKFNPRRFPSDDALTKALGNSILYLAPRSIIPTWINGVPKKHYVSITPKARKDVGKLFSVNLGLLFINLASTIESTLQTKETYRMNYMTPF